MSFDSLQTISQVLIFVGAIVGAFGTFGHFYFGQQIEREKQRTELQEKKQVASAAITQAEKTRRQQILAQLRQLYILSHDGVSSEMIAGVASLPKEWVEQQLQQRGETWRQVQYY